MTPLLLVVGITLLTSALCSLFEATLYSTRVATLEAAKNSGRHVAAATQFIRLKKKIGVPTSAILILNTIANTAGATVAGMLAADALGKEMVGPFSAVLTLTILLFAEILPKTLGASHWRPLWPFVVWALVFLEKVLKPMIWFTHGFAELLLGEQQTAATTEDEIVAMIRLSAHAGELSENELRLLTAVFRFDEAQAQDAMFPRRDVVVFDVSWSVERCVEVVRETQHTRYPLCDGSLDSSVGLVHIKDLLPLVGTPAPSDLRTIARPLRRVPATMPARQLLQEMQHSHQHMVAVVDEHGTTVGLATLENLLEQLVGSVEDEFDREVPEITREGHGVFIVRGSISIARLNIELGTNLPTLEASTLSGLVVRRLNRLPVAGDVVELHPLSVEILEVINDRAVRLSVRFPEGVPEPDQLSEEVADPPSA